MLNQILQWIDSSQDGLIQMASDLTKSYPGFSPVSNTVNPALIEGGRHPAFIVDECTLWYTIHFLSNEKLADVEREISDYLFVFASTDPWMRDHPPEFSFGGTSMFRGQEKISPASQVPFEHPAFQRFFSTCRQILGHPAESIVWPCVHDAGWQLAQAAKLYTAFILEYCGKVRS